MNGRSRRKVGRKLWRGFFLLALVFLARGELALADMAPPRMGQDSPLTMAKSVGRGIWNAVEIEGRSGGVSVLKFKF